MMSPNHIITEHGLVVPIRDIIAISKKPFKTEAGLAQKLTEDTAVAIPCYIETRDNKIHIVDFSDPYNSGIFIPGGEYCSAGVTIGLFITCWVDLTQEKKT